MAFCGQCSTQFDDSIRFCPNCGTPASAQAGGQGYGDARDAQENKVMAVLAYLSFLVFIPLFAAPNSRFARYHANQGLILFLTELAFGIVYAILSAIIFSLSWRLWFLITIVGLLGLVFLIPMVIGILNALNGRKRPLPLIGHIRILK